MTSYLDRAYHILVWRLAQVRCRVTGHDPREYRIQRARLADVLAGTATATLEYRCRRCFAEIDRP